MVIQPVNGVAAYYPTSSGTVTLGPDSGPRSCPSWRAPPAWSAPRSALPSQVNLEGLTVQLSPDALILAPDANLTMRAATWVLSGGIYVPASTTGQIEVEAGAQIDVAGSTAVSASVQENIVAAQLLGARLANSPLQQDGPLRGQTIDVDILQTGTYDGTAWVGTPLADVSGYVGLVQRTVGELTVNGGSVTLSAGNAVVMQPGAIIDVSGGWINYAGGVVQTSRVISGGHIYNISTGDARSGLSGMVGVNAGQFTVSAARYGVTETFGDPTLTTHPSAAAGSSSTRRVMCRAATAGPSPSPRLPWCWKAACSARRSWDRGNARRCRATAR